MSLRHLYGLSKVLLNTSEKPEEIVIGESGLRLPGNLVPAF